MKPHTKIYMSFFGFTTADFIPCEVCEARAVDIHHIEARGMGGDPTKSKDVIENLQALCRECHSKYGDVTGKIKEWLIKIHLKYMQVYGKKK